MALREPRRVARKGIDHDVHLGALDTDIDDLHALRVKDRQEHDDDMAELKGQLSKLVAGVWGLFLVGLGAVGAFVAALLTGRLGA